jgi:hypothetical protein
MAKGQMRSNREKKKPKAEKDKKKNAAATPYILAQMNDKGRGGK